jgi:chaperonin GroES
MPAKKPSASARSGQAGAPRKGAPAARTSARPAATPAPAKQHGDALIGTASKKGERTMANVRPLSDRVMVRRIEETEQKVGGIIIPDTAKEKPQQAEVVAVGSGRLLENGQRVAPSVKPGDKVLVGKWSGTDVKIDGDEYLILKEEEILGILG